MAMKKMLLSFDADTLERVKLIAKGRGQSTNAFMRELVARELEARDRESRVISETARVVAMERIARQVPAPSPDPRAQSDSFGRPIAKTDCDRRWAAE